MPAARGGREGGRQPGLPETPQDPCPTDRSCPEELEHQTRRPGSDLPRASCTGGAWRPGNQIEAGVSSRPRAAEQRPPSLPAGQRGPSFLRPGSPTWRRECDLLGRVQRPDTDRTREHRHPPPPRSSMSRKGWAPSGAVTLTQTRVTSRPGRSALLTCVRTCPETSKARASLHARCCAIQQVASGRSAPADSAQQLGRRGT